MGCRKLTYYQSGGIHVTSPDKELTPAKSEKNGRSAYFFGFNGQEMDNEVSGTGNTNTAMFWEYDTRMGRRWNLDPKPIVGISDYACFGNNPIANVDILGDKFIIRHDDAQAHDDVKGMAKDKNRQYIQIDKDGNVTLDFAGKSDKEVKKILRHDKGLKLINNLATSKVEQTGYDRYFFYGTQGETNVEFDQPGYQGIVAYSDLSTQTKAPFSSQIKDKDGWDPRFFAISAPKTPKGDNKVGLRPKVGDISDGKVFVASGTYSAYQATKTGDVLVKVSRQEVIYHELHENYLRTAHQYKYERAHRKAGGTGAVDRYNP